MDNSYCCVPQCTSLGSRKPRPSFHRFPPLKENNGIRRRQWIAKLRIGKKVSNRMVVCGKHFKSSDYFPVTADVNHIVKRRKLKRNAIPSCNLPTSLASDESEDNTKLKKTRKSKSKNRTPVSAGMNSEVRKLSCLEEINCHKSTGDQDEIQDKTPSSSIDEIYEECMDTSCITQLRIIVPNYSVIDVNAIEHTSENLEKYAQNYTVPLSPLKYKENTKLDYSAFESSPNDSKETLTQKLETMIAVNALLQKKLNFYQSKCKMYEKEVNIMKGVIDNLKLINSVTFGS